jgi:probable rRNA maturation factor
MSIEINNESDQSVDEVRVLRLAEHALDYMKIHPDADLAIGFIDEAAMEVLHIEWMDEPGPTDVLSFPMDELRPGTELDITPPGLLGDIVVCPQVAKTQALAAGHYFAPSAFEAGFVSAAHSDADIAATVAAAEAYFATVK